MATALTRRALLAGVAAAAIAPATSAVAAVVPAPPAPVVGPGRLFMWQGIVWQEVGCCVGETADELLAHIEMERRFFDELGLIGLPSPAALAS